MTETAIPNLTFDETARLMAEGSQWLPGGASSDYRRGTSALVIDHAEGALLFDVDGNRLIDYYLRGRSDHPRSRRTGRHRGGHPAARPWRPARRRDASRSSRRLAS